MCLHFVVRGREPNSVTGTNSSQPIVYQITYSVLEPPAAPWWRGRIAHLPFPRLSSGFSWVHPLPIYSRFPSAYPSSRLAYDPLPHLLPCHHQLVHSHPGYNRRAAIDKVFHCSTLLGAWRSYMLELHPRLSNPMHFPSATLP